ncbi:MAG TPA: helix-turn-helix domain-containing protein [Solirubrobacterales bacterium]|nr:helix-turn-helix domain-containing protein [Solirubrobacterales bacterium]
MRAMESLSLLDADPLLLAGLDEESRASAEQALQVPMMRLASGPWTPPAEGEEGLAYLVLSGMLLRRVRIEGGRSVELLAVGDCLLPWREETASFSHSEWHVVDHSRLAVLDLRPGSPLARWPALTASIAGRAIDRSRSLAVQSAIMSVVGIEERLHALLWALAERWGKVVPGGAELEVNVPQSVLAEMIGARRPTVSQALGSLEERGLLSSPRPGRWMLRGSPPPSAAGA